MSQISFDLGRIFEIVNVDDAQAEDMFHALDQLITMMNRDLSPYHITVSLKPVDAAAFLTVTLPDRDPDFSAAQTCHSPHTTGGGGVS
jgi:hypothetical protein